MFEPGAEQEKSSSSAIMVVAICIVVGLAIVGAIAYLNRGGATNTATAPASAASGASAAAPAESGGVPGHDPVKDLHILSATLAKDPSGTTAVWSVDIENRSDTYTYSNISYATSYMGADNSSLRKNQGKIPITLGPDEEKATQVRDGLYPAKTAFYKFEITWDMGAK